MGRHRQDPTKRIHKNKCQFCGAGVIENKNICGNCQTKRKLIRYMQQMIRDTDKEEILMLRYKYTHYLTCLKCGCEFTHTNVNKKYCAECEPQVKRERNRKFMAQKRAKSPLRHKTIAEVITELERYNKEHGTCLSYGQYVLRMGGT